MLCGTKAPPTKKGVRSKRARQRCTLCMSMRVSQSYLGLMSGRSNGKKMQSRKRLSRPGRRFGLLMMWRRAAKGRASNCLPVFLLSSSSRSAHITHARQTRRQHGQRGRAWTHGLKARGPKKDRAHKKAKEGSSRRKRDK